MSEQNNEPNALKFGVSGGTLKEKNSLQEKPSPRAKLQQSVVDAIKENMKDTALTKAEHRPVVMILSFVAAMSEVTARFADELKKYLASEGKDK